jgi:hypothetical protein
MKISRELITTGEHKGKTKCICEGCELPGQHTGNYRKDGSVMYRKYCAKHHSERTAKKHGLKSLTEVVAKNAGLTVTEYAARSLKNSATKAGYDNVTDYLNSKHRYRRNRIDYCENIDGRLGFVCTTTIADKSMLEVDHINNNNKDDNPNNHHTICACCHRFKTRYFGHLTNLTYIKKLFRKNSEKLLNHA